MAFFEVHVSKLFIIEPCHEKTVFNVFDQVRHKQGCTATVDG